MKSGWIHKLIGGALILATAYLLKDFYSHANSEDLSWIIAPTAFVADLFTSLSFSPEPGYGWVDVRHNVVIAPVCAGVNFLIIAFCMSAFQILWKRNSAQGLITGIIMAGLVSYLLTIVANTTRIVLAVSLFNLDIYHHWLTADMVHRLVGIVVYYLLLCFYSQAVNYCLSGKSRHVQERKNLSRKKTLLLVPLIWYLLFSVGVPFANNAFTTDPDQFIRHAVTLGAVTVLITLILYKVQRLYLSVRKDHYNSLRHNLSSVDE